MTETEKYELFKEGEKWLIFTDIKTQQEIKKLTNTGRDHSIKGEIKEAKAKLDEAKKKLGDRNLDKAKENGKNLEVSILYDGTRKLERKDQRVDLAIKFLDKHGNEVHSDSSTPVFAYGKVAKAFKPGHSKRFTKYATNAPDA